MAGLAVWVVSAERYAPSHGAPSVLDVDSPITTPALAFAALALERDPAAALFLNLSHPGRAEDLAALQRLQQGGAQVAEATRDAIEHTLAQLRGADRLLVYWVGHGVMQGNDRLLVTADSTSVTDLRTLDLQALLGHLRAPDHAPLQIGFFECCAQVVAPAPGRTALPQPAQAAMRLQHYYFSASAAETAASDTRRPGFTQSALDALRTAAWPLDVDLLHPALLVQFKRAPLASRPTALMWTDGSGELWSRRGDAQGERALQRQARAAGVDRGVLEHLLEAAAPHADLATMAATLRDGSGDALVAAIAQRQPGADPARPLRAALQRWRLVQPLLAPAVDLGLTWRQWRERVVEELARHRPDPDPHADDLAGLLLDVAAQFDEQRGIDSLLRVLECAAQASARPAAAAALRQAVTAQPALQARHAQALALLPAADAAVYLCVGVSRPAAGGAPVIDDARFLDGNAAEVLAVPPPDEGVASQLNVLIDLVMRRAPQRALTIELLVPTELLCVPRALLHFTHPELGIAQWLESDWPITLRWRNRLLNSGRFNGGMWRQRSEALRTARAAGAPLSCCFVDLAQAAAAAGSDIVALCFGGAVPDADPATRRAFVGAVYAGHPFMAWLRAPAADDAAWRAGTQALVQAHPMDALPRALADAKQLPDPTLHDLLLLIDDPERNPLDLDHAGRLDEPAVRN